MVYEDDQEVMIDGIILPGLIKSLEISTAAEIEEQEVEGSTAKPKQATGYEDGKITLELILEDSDGNSKEDKLQAIQDMFREKGQDIPAVHSIINGHAAQRNISQVLCKNLSTKMTNANQQITATIEFWEYVPMTISITAAKSAGETKYASTATNMNADYQSYLKNRGAAPKQSDKTAYTPARERGVQQ